MDALARANAKNPAVKRLLQARGGDVASATRAARPAWQRARVSVAALLTRGTCAAAALQEYKELSAEQSRDFVCEPLEVRGAARGARGSRWRGR